MIKLNLVDGRGFILIMYYSTYSDLQRCEQTSKCTSSKEKDSYWSYLVTKELQWRKMNLPLNHQLLCALLYSPDPNDDGCEPAKEVWV